MRKVPLLLTLLSLCSVLIIIERLSPTTQIILQPYNFLRVHEVFQMTIVITLSFVVSFYLLKTLSNNFELLKSFYGTMAGLLFVLGVYFNATGNGVHEMASFIFNTFCDTKSLRNGIFFSLDKTCGSAFFNDYYFGNVVYFVGLLMGNVALIMLERRNPQKHIRGNNLWIVIINGFLLAFTFIAYAAFDPVLIGMFYNIIAAITVCALLFTSKRKFTTQPFTLYCVIGYVVSAVVTVVLKLHH